MTSVQSRGVSCENKSFSLANGPIRPPPATLEENTLLHSDLPEAEGVNTWPHCESAFFFPILPWNAATL